jgi:hypothetical protein
MDFGNEYSHIAKICSHLRGGWYGLGVVKRTALEMCSAECARLGLEAGLAAAFGGDVGFAGRKVAGVGLIGSTGLRIIRGGSLGGILAVERIVKPQAKLEMVERNCTDVSQQSSF